MKKFILGLICGIALTATTAVYASESIQAYLFPVKIEINGQSKELPSEYKVLNYNGHAYVPIRFIGESLGLGVRYINSLESGKVISIMNEPTDVDETTKKIWKIQYQLKILQDQAFVKELLGDPTLVSTDQKQELVWRYDISAKSNYKFMDLGQGYNIDFNALEKGDLGAQLFISWSEEGRIMLIDLGYKQKKWIYHYYLSPDNSGINLME
ncbi:hypothetical protein GC096_00755 [Paenibacillus sp. LMG 31461]|uniref:Copper amine oxidase-like N-terminal domain-containing protein n=1 Tax=Paenibacillus plantarum TaxID=2654975 RepID=A0ABX1X3A1_9BACL|nr:stalk domain-containing protein [Paenibacillus plantarum]NOU62573.1 hypothetical protein [Paenibacillus plantarum]